MSYDKKTKARAVKLYKSGKTSTEVAELVGCRDSAVLKWARAAGVEVRTGGALGYDKKTRAKTVKLYKTGKTSTEVAELVGCNGSTVLKWLIQAGVEIRSCGQGYDKKTRARAVKLYKSGKTCLEVSEIVGVNTHSILNWLFDAGVDTRAAAAVCYNKKTKARAVKLYKSGKSSREVSEIVGCSTVSVLNWARTAGVDIRHSGVAK